MLIRRSLTCQMSMWAVQLLADMTTASSTKAAVMPVVAKALDSGRIDCSAGVTSDQYTGGSASISQCVLQAIKTAGPGAEEALTEALRACLHELARRRVTRLALDW